jgi:OPA family glycerol-3-phosphate transporter-like MFS transporter
MNTFAYAFAGLGEPLTGWLIDTTGNTGIVFAVVTISCILGAFISLFIRR